MSPSPNHASLWTRVARNTTTRFGSIAVGMMLNLVLIPFIIAKIGNAAFGIWALVNGLVGYLGILDLGLSQTLVKSAAEYLARDDTKGLGEVTATILAVYTLIGLGIIAVLLPTVPLIQRLFDVPAADQATFQIVLRIVSVQIALSFPMSIWGSLVAGMEDYHVSNGITLLGNIVRAAFTVLLLSQGFGLVALILLGLGVALLGWVLHYAWVRFRLSELTIRPTVASFKRFREVLGVSGAMFIWGIAGRTILEVDRLVIGLFMPIVQVAIYEIGLRISNYSRVVLYSAHTILPTASHLNASNQQNSVAELYLRGTRYLLFAYAIVVGALFLYGAPFIELWVGPDYRGAIPVMYVLLLGSLFQAQNVIGHVILPGIGALRTFTKLNLLSLTVKLITVFLFVHLFGLLGAALSTLTTYIIVETLFLYSLLQLLNVRFVAFARSCYAPVLVVVAPLTALFYLLHARALASGWFSLLASACVFVGLAVAFFLLWATSARERTALRSVAVRVGLIRGD